MARPLSLSGKSKLWSPKLGIRFSPPTETASIYPHLDVPRFLQTASSIHVTGSDDKSEPFEYCSPPTAKDDLAALSSPHDHDIKSRSYPEPQPTKQPHITTREQHKESTPSNIDTKYDSRNIQPPSTSLSFNISHALFHAARIAKPGSLESFWSHTMYRHTNPSGTTEKVKVHYCTSKHTMEQVCQRHFLNQQLLGLDLEWLPEATRNAGPRENVSLIQIASPDRIALFHVALFPKGDDFIAPTFRQIMEDPAVSKVGVQVKGDCTRLKNYLGVETRGIFELSHLYKQVKFTAAKTPGLINKRPVALSTQVQEVLGLPLFKGDMVRSSNWMRRLNERQLLYAASDAYAGVQLYHVLDEQRRQLDPCPGRPHHVELGLPIPVVEPELSEESDYLSDDSFSSLDSDIRTELLNMPLTPTEQPARDSRVLAAEKKASEYRAAKVSVSAQPAALRAYYIWYGNADLEPDDIAKVLRDPPLKTHTIVSYILDAIASEKMPYDKARLKTEVLSLLDENARVRGRYGELVRTCDESSEVA